VNKEVNMKISFLITLMLILSASVLSQIKPKTIKTKTSDKDIEYINRMRSEIQKAENTPTDIRTAQTTFRFRHCSNS
jgi:hypothetical protein